MKNIQKILMMPGKRVSTITLFFSTYLLSVAVHAQGNTTIGDIGNQIAESGTGVANAINILALVGGAGLFVIGLYMLASERHRSNKGSIGPIIMLVIGVMLLTWQFFAGTLGNTTLGTNATQEFLND